jgi:hypothetical protein
MIVPRQLANAIEFMFGRSAPASGTVAVMVIEPSWE